jgi:hypothetical protein
VLRRALLLAVLGMLAWAPVAVAQDPVETVPAEPGGGGGNPTPDPAPDPSPPPSSGSVSPSPPVYVPPPAAPAQPSGLTPAEIKARQRAREQRAAEKRKREAEKRIRAATHREAGEGYALPEGVALPPPLEVPIAEPEPEPAEEPTLEPEPVASTLQPRIAAPLSDPGAGSTLGSATPILVGLLILAVVLLGLAAIPPHSLRGEFGATLVHRRLELGLIGTAVLASAAIGLVLAVLSS